MSAYRNPTPPLSVQSRSLTPNTVETVPAPNPAPSPDSGQEVEASQGASFFLGMLAIALGFSVLRRLGQWKGMRSRTSLPQFQQSPCQTCRFYSNNAHLKCAVHPSKVLTKAANECSDHWPHHRDTFPR